MTRTEKTAQVAAMNASELANDHGFKHAVADVIWYHHNGFKDQAAEAQKVMENIFCQIMRTF